MNIRLFKPSVGKEELDNIAGAFERSWIGLGPNVNEFEEKWAEYIGGDHGNSQRNIYNKNNLPNIFWD